jgi:hypothetical protein
MPEDATDKIDITLRVSPQIKRQAEEIALANGLKIGEQARQFFLIGLRADQKKLMDLGLIGSDRTAEKGKPPSLH